MKDIHGLGDRPVRATVLLRALANPARVRIVEELATRPTCASGELASLLPLAPSTVSEHLRVLKDAGVLRGPIEQDPCYCLEPSALRWLAQYITGLAEAAELCVVSDACCDDADCDSMHSGRTEA